MPARSALLLLAAAFTLVASSGCATTRATDAARARDVRRAMGERLADRGDWAEARRVAESLAREDPRDAAALTLRGRALRHQGLAAEAEADLREALALDAAQPRAHAELALLCEASGRRDEALAHHQEALKLAPDDPRWLNNLAFALLGRGRAAEAVPLLQRALRAAPDDARLRNNLGFALAASGDLEGAARQFALAGSPAEARANLGFARERRGELAEAYALYLEAYQLAPSPRTARSLAALATKLGRPLPRELTAAPSVP